MFFTDYYFIEQIGLAVTLQICIWEVPRLQFTSHPKIRRYISVVNGGAAK
jgi:hypothetical protein